MYIFLFLPCEYKGCCFCREIRAITKSVKFSLAAVGDCYLTIRLDKTKQLLFMTKLMFNHKRFKKWQK